LEISLTDVCGEQRLSEYILMERIEGKTCETKISNQGATRANINAK
jgi:hypothetical protein